MKKYLLITIILLAFYVANAQKKKSSEPEKKDELKSETFGGLSFRSIGPAITSGRVVDFAVNPQNTKEYFVAAASGGVWKTSNGGITYNPVFEKEGSYSIGCVRIEPSNSNISWGG